MDNVKIGAILMEILELWKTVGKKGFVWKLGYTLEIVITAFPHMYKTRGYFLSGPSTESIIRMRALFESWYHTVGLKQVSKGHPILICNCSENSEWQHLSLLFAIKTH